MAEKMRAPADSAVSAARSEDPWKRHAQAVEALQESYRAIPRDAPVRLAKRTSYLFRPRQAAGAPGLDVSRLGQVIEVDPEARTADVQAMTTYGDLVDATLAHGLMPAVVPQLRGITLGGAITGLGIESSSFRNGMPHESVLEMEILTGDGRLITARARARRPAWTIPADGRGPTRTTRRYSAASPTPAARWVTRHG